jgi:hypothetical protein
MVELYLHSPYALNGTIADESEKIWKEEAVV